MRGTKRQDALRKALRALIPRAPLADFEPILTAASSARFKSLPPGIVVKLATIAHARHVHSEYDALLAEGYDRDAARFFVREDIERMVGDWGWLWQPDSDEESELPDRDSPPKRRRRGV